MTKKTIILGRLLERGNITSLDEVGYTVQIFPIPGTKAQKKSIPYSRAAPNLEVNQQVLVHKRDDADYIEALDPNSEVVDYVWIKGPLLLAPTNGVEGIAILDTRDNLGNHLITIAKSDTDLERLEGMLRSFSLGPRACQTYHGSNDLTGRAYTTVRKFRDPPNLKDGVLFIEAESLVTKNEAKGMSKLKPYMLEYCVECALLE